VLLRLVVRMPAKWPDLNLPGSFVLVVFMACYHHSVIREGKSRVAGLAMHGRGRSSRRSADAPMVCHLLGISNHLRFRFKS
jgi:hypothetical protein